MAKSYIKIIIDTKNNSLNLDQESINEILMAELAEFGFDTFDSEDSLFNAYILKSDFDQNSTDEIVQKYELMYSLEEIPFTNWNKEWEKNFSPISIDSFVHLRSEFHPIPDNFDHVITIQPKMAFGTGHHATTRCMMRQMQNIDFSGKVVLDMGTGTGILAILAEKLGAEGVLAADYDEIAVDNTLENLELNYTKKIDAEQYSHPDEIHEEFDIILANINRNVLLDHLEGYSNIIVPQGILLLSGFYEQDTNILIEKAKQCGFKHIETIHENEWFCLKFEKN